MNGQWDEPPQGGDTTWDTRFHGFSCTSSSALCDFAWQSGFGVFSVSESAAGDVVAYIRDPERHYRRMPFAEELRLFLERHGVDYDPEHYLD